MDQRELWSRVQRVLRGRARDPRWHLLLRHERMVCGQARRRADLHRAARSRLRFGTIQQDYLEASNVDPVTEITNLISAQRAYEMNSKVIQAADQMSGTISNLRS